MKIPRKNNEPARTIWDELAEHIANHDEQVQAIVKAHEAGEEWVKHVNDLYSAEKNKNEQR